MPPPSSAVRTGEKHRLVVDACSRHVHGLTPRKVLVVDDNEDAAGMLKDMLELSGHEVRVSYTPLEALVNAGEFKPEFVLLDIGLPGMDGYELARRLRESMPSVPMKMIALTGYARPSDHEKSKSQGFAGHVVKPIEMDDLLALLDA